MIWIIEYFDEMDVVGKVVRKNKKTRTLHWFTHYLPYPKHPLHMLVYFYESNHVTKKSTVIWRWILFYQNIEKIHESKFDIKVKPTMKHSRRYYYQIQAFAESTNIPPPLDYVDDSMVTVKEEDL